MRARDPFLVLLVVLPLSLALSGGGSDPVGEELFRFADPAVVESSGAVVLESGLVVTVNDSGDEARVFTVDGEGRTVGVTRWGSEPDDVEALAAAGPDSVWVGDIGDNGKTRASVSVTEVPVGTGDRDVEATTYALTYPDGPRDAEALLSDPATGRLYVASKVVFGGTLYAAPRRLDADGPNVLEPVRDVAGLVTDGTFLPDGRHLVLRSYDHAYVLAFPSLEPVADFGLPAQAQGEGVAAYDDTTLLLTSEGVRAPVLKIPLPEGATAVRSPDGSSAVASTFRRIPAEPGPPVWPWVVGALITLGALAVGVRSSRP